ncbi:putative T-lymphocyte activation antigen CD80-like [Triplophysa rosa]|uniref:T-lymphocyte activation antigen CD80-like n=1 Tax=Triplophysa rosa TaxID=992332 RepID=A0A9W7WSY6_TRIRA|nr:putative T-lymphocyte activation antigen CD80-like [Triplophysa rosa]
MENTYFSALLLASLIMSQAEECIVGVIEEHVQLPCIYNGVKNLTSLLLSSEWKRDVEVIHTTNWTKQQEDTQNVSRSTTVPSSAPNSGDFTMVLRDIRLSDAQNYSFHLKLQGQENSILVCTVCLTVAGHFSHTTVLRENIVNGEKTQLVCNTRGGFPAPNIYWIINHTQRPPKTTIITYVNTLPQSQLYNITSVLSINISPDTVVAYVIENDVLNETSTTTNCECPFSFWKHSSLKGDLTESIQMHTIICTVIFSCCLWSDGVKSNVVHGRLSKYLWLFSTVLCVVVFLLVAASLCYQRNLDRDIKRRNHFRCGGTDVLKFLRFSCGSSLVRCLNCVDIFICVAGDSCSEDTELIVMDMKLWASLPETDV